MPSYNGRDLCGEPTDFAEPLEDEHPPDPTRALPHCDCERCEAIRARCQHPPTRNYAWYAADRTLCVACCDCGATLAGGC